MAVIDIARKTVVTVDPEATLSDVVQTMRTERGGSVIVVSDGEPIGLVSDWTSHSRSSSESSR